MVLFSYLIVADALDLNIFPAVLGMTNCLLHEAIGRVQYNLWSFPGPKGKCSSKLHMNHYITYVLPNTLPRKCFSLCQ